MNTTNYSNNSKLKSHFLNLFSFAIADADVSANELELFYNIGIENGASREEIDYLIENPHKVNFIKPDTIDESLDQLYDFCRMILADNRVDVREIMFFKSLVKQFDFNDAQATRLLDVFIDGLRNGEDKISLISQAKQKV